MKSAELRAALAAMGMTQAEFARAIDRDAVTVNRWCNEKVAVPRYVEFVVREMLREAAAE